VGAGLSPVAQSSAVAGQRLVVQAAGGTATISHTGTIAGGTGPQATGWAMGELL